MLTKIAYSLTVLAIAGWTGAASASPMAEVESNDSFGTAQDVNAGFSLDFDIRIEDENLVNTSTLIPHVEIFGGGDDSYDLFTFDVTLPGSIAIFDIDCTFSGGVTACPDAQPDDLDTEIWLYDASFSEIANNDDYFFGLSPDTGSDLELDSFIQLALNPGTYYIEVGSYFNGEIQDGQEYILNISVGPGAAPVPEPGILALFGLGLAGLGFSRRRSS